MTSEDIQILRREYFSQPCTSLAPALIGQLLCRKLPSGIILRAEVTSSIVEIGEVLQWKLPRLLMRQKNTLTNNWFNQAKLILKFPQIVETEAYPAGCPRVPKATHGPGSTFIYSIYGVIRPNQHHHYDFNTITTVIIFKNSSRSTCSILIIGCFLPILITPP